MSGTVMGDQRNRVALDNDGRLKELLRDSLRQKDIIKWGYTRLFGGATATSCDSVASHVASVATLATILSHEYADEIFRLTDTRLDLGRVTLLALLHDLGECRSGDTGATGHAVHGTCNLHSLEREGLDGVTKDLAINKIALDLFDDYRAYRTPEAIMVHLADNIDGYEKGMSVSFGRGEAAAMADRILEENLALYENKKEIFPEMASFIQFCLDKILLRAIAQVREAYS